MGMNLLSAFIKAGSFVNVSREHVSVFHVEKGMKLEKGDPVVVHKRTLQACKPVVSSQYFAVGVAANVIEQEKGNQTVICIDGYHTFYDPDKNISKDDIGLPCYFLDDGTITMDDTNKTKVGIVMDIVTSTDPIDIADGVDRVVWVKTDITEGECIKW